MSIKPLHSLSVRSGFMILAGSVLLTLVMSAIFYQRQFQEQLSSADRQLQQLVTTVENSAAVAAYLDNEELATEVVRGLAENDIVASASLRSESGMKVVAGAISELDEDHQRSFVLKAPFMPDESIGTLWLQPDHARIEANARETALIYVATLMAHSLLLTLLAIALVRWQLARPLTMLAQSLHKIEPGSASRLAQPGTQRQDEVGQLVADINGLLDSTQLTLEGERRLRQYVEAVERRFRLIFDHASCGIALVRPDGELLLSNPSFDTLMLRDTSSDAPVNMLYLFDNATHVRELLGYAVSHHSPVSDDLQLSGTRGGHARWLHALFSSVQNEQGEHLVECILYDISERAEREKQVRQEAEHDVLTQLYNRRAGERRLLQALEEARRDERECALMLIDLDRFKPINDTYGHDAGDRVLVTVAQRLTHSLRKDDIVIRWGGDEFVVLTFPSDEVNAVSVIAHKLLEQICQPVDLGIGHSDQVGASIGIALFPSHGIKLGDLITRADRAMYQVKERGRNQFLIYQAPARPLVRGA